MNKQKRKENLTKLN